MPIDRTWWNNLIDDDGSGTKGTVWNKAAIAGLLDAIDGLFEVDKPWTPLLTFGGSNAGLAFSSKIGRYSRADEIVLLEARFVMTAKGTATGLAQILGLPYPCKAGTTFAVASLDPEVGFVNIPGALSGQLQGSGIYLLSTGANTSARIVLTDAHFSANTAFNLSVAYRKA